MCGGYTGEHDEMPDNNFVMTQKKHPGGEGIQRVYRFSNELELSVIKTPWSYGGKNNLWEIAAMDSDGNFVTQEIWSGLDDDVIGHVTDEQLKTYLEDVHKHKVEE